MILIFSRIELKHMKYTSHAKAEDRLIHALYLTHRTVMSAHISAPPETFFMLFTKIILQVNILF